MRARVQIAGRGQDWRAAAGCAGHDPELWFPIGSSGEARTICGGCPVQTACLNWAIRTGQEWGIWGGLDADERRALRRAAWPEPDPLPATEPRVDWTPENPRGVRTAGRRWSPGQLDELARLAGQGLSDRQIGAVVSRGRTSVRNARVRYDIPAGGYPGRRLPEVVVPA